MAESNYDIQKFYLGPVCLRGHVWNNANLGLRYISNHSCRECTTESYGLNKEKIKNDRKEYRKRNKEKIRKYWQERRKNPEFINRERERQKANRLKRRESAQRYCEKNRGKIRIRQRNYYKAHKKQIREKIAGDYTIRLHQAVSRAIRNHLKAGIKNKCKWETLIGYSVEDLKKHLEQQFDEKMTWENYGSYWQIDHIIPRRVFNFGKPEDIDFKRCWALNNLRPLEKNKNQHKQGKLLQPFQPALILF